MNVPGRPDLPAAPGYVVRDVLPAGGDHLGGQAGGGQALPLLSGSFPHQQQPQEQAFRDALTSMLIGSFYGCYVTIAGIPDGWPDRVLSTIWPHDTSPASPHHNHNP